MNLGRNDALLAPLLQSGDDARRTETISALLDEHVLWRIDRILGARFRNSGLPADSREDMRGEVILRLIHRLQQVMDDPASAPIESFPGYVAVVAFNTFDDFVRRAFPIRARLKNRVRYTLGHTRGLALWPSGGTICCGLEEWRGRPAAELRADVAGLHVHARRDDLPRILRAIFGHYGQPMELDAVVALVAETCDVRDVEVAAPLRDTHGSMPAPDPIQHLENLQYLRTAWAEIAQLPRAQRVALLLNARDQDGESIVRALPVTGVATVREISDVLSMPAEDLAALWSDLPIDDARIAEMLQLTRQQVINLRRAARERLIRRMRGVK